MIKPNRRWTQIRGKGNIGTIFETLALGFIGLSVRLRVRRRSFARSASYPRPSALIRGWVFSFCLRVHSRLPFAVLFADTKLAEDAAEKILSIMSPDDITDGIECASKLNRNELG